jgi:hypothetical protein
MSRVICRVIERGLGYWLYELQLRTRLLVLFSTFVTSHHIIHHSSSQLQKAGLSGVIIFFLSGTRPNASRSIRGSHNQTTLHTCNVLPRTHASDEVVKQNARFAAHIQRVSSSIQQGKLANQKGLRWQ